VSDPELAAWLGSEPVGSLARSSRRYQLRFTRRPGAAAALTVARDGAEATWSPAFTWAWFDNLLPEEGRRTAAEVEHEVERGDTFGLLAAIGWECAGAVSVLPDGRLPASGSYRALGDEEVWERLDALPRRVAEVDREVRLSLGDRVAQGVAGRRRHPGGALHSLDTQAISAILVPVMVRVLSDNPAAVSGHDEVDPVEQIRRDFATGWGRIGAAWGIAPSTATVQGYLLAHGGPLTELELREALGLSHKAAFGAIVACRGWGLIEEAGTRRAGQRGPAGRAWVPVGDHWDWFRRVAAERKERETDPVLPLLDACLERATLIGDAALAERLGSLVRFNHEFDRGIGAVVGAPSPTLARLAGALTRLDEPTVRRLLDVLAGVPEDELAASARNVARMRPAALRRLLRLAGRPELGRLLGRGGPR
jgi:serine/threonine-protein kinase HipA